MSFYAEYSGNVNKPNCRFWGNSNLHWFGEVHTQYPEKLNVWAGILGDALIGPLFIPGYSTGYAGKHHRTFNSV